MTELQMMTDRFEDQRQLAKELTESLTRLGDAVRELYYAAHWTPDRECDATRLWEQVCDAAKLTPGNAPREIPEQELVIPKGCNRHSNCKDAEAEYAKLHGRHPGFNFHCHDDSCEDCFGQ